MTNLTTMHKNLNVLSKIFWGRIFEKWMKTFEKVFEMAEKQASLISKRRIPMQGRNKVHAGKVELAQVKEIQTIRKHMERYFILTTNVL